MKHMPVAPHYLRDLLEGCLDLPPPPELDLIVHKAVVTVSTEPDPESAYYQGAILAFCGRKPAAINTITNAIGGDYCAYSQLQSDPLLVKLRGTSEFDRLLAAAKECQQRYRVDQD